MLIAFWIFDFCGALYLSLRTDDFDKLLELYSEAMTQALWAYAIFAGVEGGMDMISRYRDRKNPEQDYSYPVNQTMA